jgi:hypothetical protein
MSRGNAESRKPNYRLPGTGSAPVTRRRTTSGTLRLRDEDRGLAFEADLGDGPTAQDVREMVKRGDVSGASFRFVVGDETWEGERRTVTEIAELIDLSLATTPAYEGPRVEFRSRPETTTVAVPQQKEPDMSEAKTEERTEAPEGEERGDPGGSPGAGRFASRRGPRRRRRRA